MILDKDLPEIRAHLDGKGVFVDVCVEERSKASTSIYAIRSIHVDSESAAALPLPSEHKYDVTPYAVNLAQGCRILVGNAVRLTQIDHTTRVSNNILVGISTPTG